MRMRRRYSKNHLINPERKAFIYQKVFLKVKQQNTEKSNVAWFNLPYSKNVGIIVVVPLA